MAAAQFTIGADVSCTDGACGKVARVVLDPAVPAVTHLVVDDRQYQGRLVPLGLVDAAAGEIGSAAPSRSSRTSSPPTRRCCRKRGSKTPAGTCSA